MPYADLAVRKEYSKRYAREHSRDARDRSLRFSYGITLYRYEQLVVEQCGACAICGVVPGEDPDAKHNQGVLHVDHDHKTGLIRGLLCSDCNRGVGLLKEDPDLLLRAAQYIEENK